MAQAPLTIRRWKRSEYDRLVELGVFEGEPLELIGGQLVVAEPQYPYHASEVAESSVSFDRQHKGSLYARAGLQDYWIVNLVDRVLEVYRDPAPDTAAMYGWRHRSVTPLTPPALVSPLAFPAARIAVGDLLP
jgi:Uma2 family endonuclease